MFDEKITELENSIVDINNSIVEKTDKVKELLNEDNLEEARTVKSEIEAKKAELEDVKNDLKLFKEAEKGEEKPMTENKVVVDPEVKTNREAVNDFIRSKGKITNEVLEFGEDRDVLISFNEITPTTDGVKKTDTKPITSEEILYTPTREINTVTDLKPFTTVYPAKKASGKYPVLARATAKLISVEELEKNPALAKPEFKHVDWSVETFRGAIPLSQESIDDADVDLVSLVAESITQMKVNTTNDAIATVLKSFTAKTVTKLDDIKELFNKGFDPAYNIGLIVSQSFYQTLDTLKDGNGRYLLQDDITSASGKVLLGKPVFVLSDDVLGANTAFIGDFKRGVLFADRKELGLRWADNDIYGQYLQAVLRFGVSKVDEKAGYFVTYTPSEA